jgi:transcriptional regulator with XRE-family HTH domain
MSSISKHNEDEQLGPRARLAIGERIRARRVASGLSQAALGAPRTRSFVSQVEHGHIAPSLASLFALADRLGLDPAELIVGVKPDTAIGYTPVNGNETTRAAARPARRRARR